jgi:uncharacterized membrane protein YgdD (TMEM256/DUF423 family)
MDRSGLQKTPSGNLLRSNLNEGKSFVEKVFNAVATQKLYYTYHTIFILLLILSMVDIIKTYKNSNKTKTWEYAVGTLGFFGPLILYGIKGFNMFNRSKVAITM